MSLGRSPHLRQPVVWLALALAVLWPVGIQAQEATPTLQSLTIELWPEFDRAGVLVIYNGVLAPTADLPAQVSLLLPVRAELNAVAYRGAGDELLNAGYETQPAGDRTRLTVAVENSNFWVEFYMPAETIRREDSTRSFTHTWDGDLAVERLIWRVQQPATASGLLVEPGGGQMVEDRFGLPSYVVEGGALAEGETASASVIYYKTDDVLTASQLPAPPTPAAQAVGPAATPAPAPRSNLRGLLPVGLAVLGVALLTAGVLVYWRSGRQAGGPRPAPRARRQAAGYCTNCGSLLQPGDKFCRECGTPVRA